MAEQLIPPERLAESLKNNIRALWCIFPLFLSAIITTLCSPAHAQYVQIQGAQFVKNGVPVRLYGGTLYLTYDGTRYLTGGAFASKSEVAEVDTYLDTWTANAQNAHMNCLRVTDWIPDDSAWNNPVIYQQLDYLLKDAKKRHIYLVLDLSAYRNWLLHKKLDPYDPKNWTDFIRFIGNHFKHSHTFVMYGIAGEVPAPNYSKTNPTADTLLNFFREVSIELYHYDPNHLIASGGFIFMDDPHCGIPWRRIFSLPHINIASIHAYAGKPDGVATAAYKYVGGWANRHHIPFMVEEWGYKQALGDAVRARLYQDNYNIGVRYKAVGMLFWNWGGETMQNDGSKTAMDVNPSTPLTCAVVSRNCKERTEQASKK